MEAAIPLSMPEPDRDLNLCQGKTPGAGINFGINQQAIGRNLPGLALAFEAGVERFDIAHHPGVTWLKKFQQERAETDWDFDREKRADRVKRKPQQFTMARIKEEEPAVKREQTVAIP